MQFSNRVTTITQDEIIPAAVDTFLSDNFISFRFLSNAAKWRGHQMSKPLKIGKSSLGGSFSGLDTHSTSTVESRVLMTYDVRGYEMPIAIPGMEKAVNRTDAQVLDLVAVETESAQQDALDDVAEMLYGDGTGNSNKDFIGLDALNDDGTSVVTLGGLSRTTYPTIKSTRTASGGNLSLTNLATLTSNVSSGSSMRRRPSVIVSGEGEWDLYESLLTPMVRSNYQANGQPMVTRSSAGVVSAGQLNGAQGYAALTYRGISWVADEKAPSGTIWMLNEKDLQWYGLADKDMKQISLGKVDMDNTYSDAPSKYTGFQWTDFMNPINQYGMVAHLYLLGNFTSFNPKTLGRLTGVTGV